LKFEVDKTHKVVDFYIEDEYGKEHLSTKTFGECSQMIDELKKIGLTDPDQTKLNKIADGFYEQIIDTSNCLGVIFTTIKEGFDIAMRKVKGGE